MGASTDRCARLLFTRTATTEASVILQVLADAVSNSLTIYSNPTIPAALTCDLSITGKLDTSGLIYTSGGLRITGNPVVSDLNGCYIAWNRSGNQGETWIMNQIGSGTGASGIVFGTA
jgi:hypothetical protein